MEPQTSGCGCILSYFLYSNFSDSFVRKCSMFFMRMSMRKSLVLPSVTVLLPILARTLLQNRFLISIISMSKNLILWGQIWTHVFHNADPSRFWIQLQTTTTYNFLKKITRCFSVKSSVSIRFDSSILRETLYRNLRCAYVCGGPFGLDTVGGLCSRCSHYRPADRPLRKVICQSSNWKAYPVSPISFFLLPVDI